MMNIPDNASAFRAAGKANISICTAAVVICLIFVVLSPLKGLPPAGQKVLGIALVAIAFWSTEMLPIAVTGMMVVILLAVSGSVSGLKEALFGFAQPVVYFLIGVLTIGSAVLKSGLAERAARYFLLACKGNPRKLYIQLLVSFPLLTLILPSATTRSAILIHVYEQVLELSRVPRNSSLSKAIMMALNSINRLASTMLLTGGITPVLSAAMVGGVAWSRWFVLMSVPYGVLLAAGGIILYRNHSSGFSEKLSQLPGSGLSFLTKMEVRTAIITFGTSALWLTDAVHHLNPALPALFAWILLLAPGVGVLKWKEFERSFGWSNFFVLATSLSLANAIIKSGTGAWIADTILNHVPLLTKQPLLVVIVLLVCAAFVRLLIPNITGFLAITIPVAMAIGKATGLNPLLCGLIVMIAGDSVLYYPAQSASSLVVYERGYLSAPEIFRFGALMTVVAFLVVLLVALPYWTAVGEPLF
ncbi:MAG: anion permease [Deltaproteobacteria bacterium]|nr:anion permease [Deltaproteobacteria bacterium]